MHAVPRPVSAPRPTTVKVHRIYGSVLAALIGGVEVHGPSTDKLTTTLAWTDLVDDLTLEGPVERTGTASGFDVSVRPSDRLVPLWVLDQTVPLPGWEGVVLRSTTHALPDTKHHRVRYRFRASTRFREYFDPRLLAPDPTNPVDDGQSVVSEELEISVPSTVRPDAPKVHSVLPLFRWGATRAGAAVRTSSGSSPRPADLPRSAVELEWRRRAAGRAARRRRRRQPGLPAAQGEPG